MRWLLFATLLGAPWGGCANTDEPGSGGGGGGDGGSGGGGGPPACIETCGPDAPNTSCCVGATCSHSDPDEHGNVCTYSCTCDSNGTWSCEGGCPVCTNACSNPSAYCCADAGTCFRETTDACGTPVTEPCECDYEGIWNCESGSVGGCGGGGGA